VDRRLSESFLVYGGAIGAVKKYSVSNDAYYLTYSAMMVTMNGLLFFIYLDS
jgi:hypothetical protein